MLESGASFSLVEGEHPVAPSDPKGSDTSDGPEATMVLGSPLPDVLMSAVAEGRIGGQLAVAELIVARLHDAEGDGAAASKDPLALTIAEWVELRVAASTPCLLYTSPSPRDRG